MVLIRTPFVLLVVVAGCNQSLFDDHGAGKAGIDASGEVPAACPSPCIADAAADFDGTAGGVGSRWRYLDDHRNRTWTPMAGDATKTGADPANHIAACAATPSHPACEGLPGALLMTSAGATSAADPAIELTVTTTQVIQLSLRALVASGDAQRIRLYRNSREDVLFTGTAAAGTALDHAITLDALAGDRFVLAVAPTTNGAEVAIQLFVNPTGAAFPSTCQVALSFAAASGNTVDNQCGGDFTHTQYSGNDSPPVLAGGPFAELGSAADLISDAYFESTTMLDKTGDTTVQLWVKQRAFVEVYDAWLFSDLDLNDTGGLGIAITNSPTPQLDIATCTVATQTTLEFDDAVTPYPTDGGWHFVRVVHTNGTAYLCLDGVRKTSMPVPAGFLRSGFAPRLGRNVVWTPQGAFVDGELDDVRVIRGALPCE